MGEDLVIALVLTALVLAIVVVPVLALALSVGALISTVAALRRVARLEEALRALDGARAAGIPAGAEMPEQAGIAAGEAAAGPVSAISEEITQIGAVAPEPDERTVIGGVGFTVLPDERTLVGGVDSESLPDVLHDVTDERAHDTEELPGRRVAGPADETVYGGVDTRRLPDVERTPAPPAAAGPPPTPPAAPALRAPPVRPPGRPLSVERVVVWVASIIGGFLLVLAALLAMVVTLERGWLGPPTRVALGLGAGTSLWLLGSVLRWRRFRLIGSALSGAGLGTLYGTLYAAAGYYDLLSRPVAFGLMTAVTAVSLSVSVRHRDRFMAHLGTVGGLLTPILVSTGENNPVGLFAYLTLLGFGAVLAATRRRWWDLVLVDLLGTVGLYVGWTATWYAADQAPVALISALVLSLPFAMGALPRRSSLPVAVVGLCGAVILPLAALPWLVPVDPVFSDPVNGLAVVRPLGSAAAWAAGALGLLPIPAWIAARRRGGWPATLAGGMTAFLLTAVAVGAWCTTSEPPATVLAAGALAALAAALLVHPAARASGWGLLPVPIGAGVALATVFAATDAPGLAVLGGGAALVVIGVLLAAVASQPWLLLATLAGEGIALAAAAARVDVLGARWVAGPAVLAYALLATVPMLRRRRSTGAALTAALAGVVLFFPLYECWDQALGQDLIGVLPVVLGAVSLLAAAVLVRVHRVASADAALALFVAVSLLGVTSAVPVQLHDEWLTVAWGLEGAALAWLARRLTHPLLRWTSVVLAVAVAIRLLVNPWALEYGDTAGWPILNWTLYTWGVPALCLIVGAGWLSRARAGSTWVQRLDGEIVPAVVRVLGILVGFALVNVEVSDLFQDAGPVELGGHGLLQGMVRSLSWAGYGVVVLIAGLVARGRSVRLVGFALVLLATAKVFAVDLWSLSGFVRVGSVLGLAVSLLLAAFLFERLVLRRSEDSTPGRTP